MLCDLQDEFGLAALYLQGVEDRGKPLLKLDVHHGTDDSHNLSLDH